MKKAAIYTLGCKVNTYDSEAIREILEKNGYKTVEFDEQADVYVINTCTVTNLGDKKSRQMIRKAKKNNPMSIVVVCGCYAQTSPEVLEEMPEVDVLMGTNERSRIIEYIQKKQENNETFRSVKDIMEVREFEALSIEGIQGRTRDFIKIQEGCDRFCSYCIIPYARGPIRSRNPEEVLKEVRQIVNNGSREIVLTGIHISSYGKDLKMERGLLELIQALENVEGLQRIRISSLEPGIMTEAFIQELAKCTKVCDHFHLSLQSGSKTVLQRMKRRYSPEEYRKATQLLRTYFPNCSLTTDVMVGFPGETEEEFEESYRFIKDIAFSTLHVFKYSKREGTPAAKYADQVPAKVKDDRSKRLIALSEDLAYSYQNRFLNQKMPVLMESRLEDQPDVYQGHTTNYLLVRGRSDRNLVNQIVTVQLESIENDHVVGSILKES